MLVTEEIKSNYFKTPKESKNISDKSKGIGNKKWRKG